MMLNTVEDAVVRNVVGNPASPWGRPLTDRCYCFNDGALFQVNQTWRDLMRRTEDRPNAIRAATGAGVLESLQACNSSLEKIQKSLEVSFL